MLRVGEGRSGKINKTSLGFILFLFQNKQSYGVERAAGAFRAAEYYAAPLIKTIWIKKAPTN